MTEEDAKTKWCPFARVIPGFIQDGEMFSNPAGIPAHNRIQERGTDTPTWHGAMSCIGSECMAWRWTTYEREEGLIMKPTGPYSARGTKEHEGYCGLAGKP